MFCNWMTVKWKNISQRGLLRYHIISCINKYTYLNTIEFCFIHFTNSKLNIVFFREGSTLIKESVVQQHDGSIDHPSWSESLPQFVTKSLFNSCELLLFKVSREVLCTCRTMEKPSEPLKGTVSVYCRPQIFLIFVSIFHYLKRKGQQEIL